jgi:chromosome partitioning protein
MISQIMAHIVSVANTKGGVGKSTLSGNLAWAFATHRTLQRRVLLVDSDTQASVTKWFDLAGDVPFDRTQLCTARVLQAQLPKLRKMHDLIIVDCPPMQSDVTAAAVAVSNLAIVPVQPSPLDVLAYSELVPLLRQAQAVNENVRLRFVVNQLSSGTVLAREVEESLADAEIPLCRTRIHDRQAYRRVVSKGQSVMQENGPARDELVALAKEIAEALTTEGTTS